MIVSHSRSISLQVLVGILLLILSIRVFVLFLSPGLDDYYKARYSEMIYGDAYRPYVTRALLPVLVRTLTGILPKEKIDAEIGAHPVAKFVFEKLNWDQEYFTEFLLGAALMYLFLLGYLWSLLSLFDSFFHAPWGFRMGILFAALILLIPFFRFTHIYDFPTLCLMTLGLSLMVRQRWLAFLGVFLLSAINRETTVLLTLVFSIHYRSRLESMRNPWSFRALLIAQIVLYGIIRGGLAMIYKENPGSLFEFHLLDNLVRYREMIPLSTFVAWGVVLLAIYKDWREKPLFLRNALWMAVPIAALLFFGGIGFEFRVFYEVMPVALILAGWTVARELSIPIEVRPVGRERRREKRLRSGE